MNPAISGREHWSSCWTAEQQNSLNLRFNTYIGVGFEVSAVVRLYLWKSVKIRFFDHSWKPKISTEPNPYCKAEQINRDDLYRWNERTRIFSVSESRHQILEKRIIKCTWNRSRTIIERQNWALEIGLL